MGISGAPLRPQSYRVSHRGFTLLEMLVAITILTILLVALFELTAGVGNIWKSSGGKISAFQSARSAFSTLNETLSRATLNTYTDYVSVIGGVSTFRTAANASTFVPTQFTRASELHFLCGPTVDIANATQTTTGNPALNINAIAARNPGDTVYFQAPLGITNQPSVYLGMKRAINSVGFYVQYEKTDTTLLPPWLVGMANTSNYHYQLVEYVEATENLQIYTSTSTGSYLLNWMTFAGTPRARVLAEDVVLLLLRPRLSPADEATVAAGLGEQYNEATQLGSILCPNYHYDSRAWETGYPTSASGTSSRVNAVAYGPQRAQFMSNQVPPIIDVAMVCVDAHSLARFNTTTSTPPSALVPNNATWFTNSANMEADLTSYAAQLSSNNIRFHIQRGAIEIQGAKWSNN